jgi:hypothetical protein
MRSSGIQFLAGLAALCVTGLAVGAPCFLILDRDDTVIYRDTVPPFDLSTSGSPERAALRQRGQHLLVAEFDRCDAVGSISPTTGGTSATVDDIVMGLKPAAGTSVGMSGNPAPSSASGTSTGARSAPTPPQRSPAPAKKSY